MRRFDLNPQPPTNCSNNSSNNSTIPTPGGRSNNSAHLPNAMMAQHHAQVPAPHMYAGSGPASGLYAGYANDHAPSAATYGQHNYANANPYASPANTHPGGSPANYMQGPGAPPYGHPMHHGNSGVFNSPRVDRRAGHNMQQAASSPYASYNHSVSSQPSTMSDHHLNTSMTSPRSYNATPFQHELTSQQQQTHQLPQTPSQRHQDRV